MRPASCAFVTNSLDSFASLASKSHTANFRCCNLSLAESGGSGPCRGPDVGFDFGRTLNGRCLESRAPSDGRPAPAGGRAASAANLPEGPCPFPFPFPDEAAIEVAGVDPPEVEFALVQLAVVELADVELAIELVEAEPAMELVEAGLATEFAATEFAAIELAAIDYAAVGLAAIWRAATPDALIAPELEEAAAAQDAGRPGSTGLEAALAPFAGRQRRWPAAS